MRDNSTSSPLSSIHDSVGYWSSLLAKTMEAEFNKRLADYGVTRVAYAVLGAMRFDGMKTPSDLAAFLGLDRAAVTRLLDRLEEQKLIARRQAEHDRRSVSLSVTAKGQHLADALGQESRAVNAQFTAGLTSDEIRRYVETVKRLLANSSVNLETL